MRAWTQERRVSVAERSGQPPFRPRSAANQHARPRMLDGKHGGKSEGVRAMSKRGSGGIYLRGTTWWVRYYLHGHEFRESAETDSETVARKFLTKRIRESGRRGK